MKKRTIILLLLAAGTFVNAQNLTLIKSIPTTSSFAATDNLGNVYLIKGASLDKFDSEGKFLKNLSKKGMGNISFIDAHDPLKTLVYYQAFQQLAFIDNSLGNSQVISLEAIGYGQATLVCASHNNGFWLYNPTTFELIRFDENLKVAQQTGNITQVSGVKVQPNFIIEQNDLVFMNDSANGILVFDIYGTYSRTIPIKGLLHFQVSDDQIFYLKDGRLKSYHLKTLQEDEMMLPDGDILDARTEKEKLYLLKQKSLDIYNTSK